MLSVVVNEWSAGEECFVSLLQCLSARCAAVYDVAVDVIVAVALELPVAARGQPLPWP